MLRSRNRTTRDRFAARTSIRVLSSFAVLSLGALVIASVSVLSHAAREREKDSPLARPSDQRVNHRLAMHPHRAATTTGSSMKALAPMASTITVDRADDTFAASACTAAANDCSLRGAVAFANVNPGTTIIVPAGTYLLNIPGGVVEGFNGDDSIGDLDITASGTIISGAGAATTVIRQTQPNDRVIEVNPFLDAAFTFSISDVTIDNGHETTAVGGGGILGGSQNNVITITNCIFSGNSATGAGTFGGGGICYTGGDLNISGTTFSGNSTSASGGGVSYSAGDPLGRTPSAGVLTVADSAFTGNTAASTAAGGGAADLYDFNLSTGVYNFSRTSFSGNTATNSSGGAIVVESGGPLTITTSSFSANSAQGFGGAIMAGGTAASVQFSRLVGNTVPLPANGTAIFSNGGSVNANDDWWGVNAGPGVNSARSTSGTIPVLTWLQLQNLANPNTICTGGTSSLTANIKRRNVGPDLTVELNGLPPFPVPPAPVFGAPVLGTLSAVSTQFVNGSATATFTAGATPGTGGADAFADNESATASIIIQNNTATTPADQSVCQGATATFSTTAGGAGPIHYAWTLDGSPYDGDNPSISVDTTPLSIGSHPVTVTVTGACSSVTKSATLTVQANTTATAPADQTVCQGATASFSTTASGANLHYAWTVDGSSFDGDNSSISVPTGALTAGNHPVTVTVSGDCGTVTKNATLTVQASTTATTPADQTVCEGGSATFSTTAGGTGPFSYAWTVDGSPFGGNTSSITVSGASAGSHPITVTVTGTCGSVTKNATLTVNANTATSDPADQTVCQGATAIFSTTASGTSPFSYAWTVDGSPAGGNSSSLSVPTGSLSIGNHTITVTTTGACGSASQSATLTVQENTTATTPADQTVCQGATASFSTTASGTNLHYAWTVDGSAFGGDTSSISVPTGSLTATSHAVAVTVTGACGVVTRNATLTAQANTAATTPNDQTVCQGSTASFSTTASGTAPLHYAWTVDGSAFGGDTASISVATGSLSVGSHPVTVTVSGSCGTITKNATLNVQATTSATTPAAQTVCQGATATFSTTASGTGPFTYQWRLDGSNIAGATGSSVNINTTSVSAGNHTVDVVVNGACGSVLRSTTLTVNTAPVVTTNPVSQTATSGTVTFTAAASGSPAPTVQWQVSTNGGATFSNISGATSTSLTVTVSPAVNGNQYRAVFTNGCGSATTTAATLTTCSPPVIILSHSTLSMWPPNHSYHTFDVTDFVGSATSNCFGNITGSVVITSVTSDEIENGNGDGNTLNDIVIAANCRSVQLRSERDGGGDGRVYRISFKVTDAAGNVATATATVTVPHSQNGSVAIDSGAKYTVNSACP